MFDWPGTFDPGVMATADVEMATADGVMATVDVAMATADVVTPEQFKDATQKYSVGRGESHTVLVDGTGQAWTLTWLEDLDLLGLGKTPQQIPTIDDIIGVSCGDFHTVLVKRDGTAWSFGHNYHGLLGLGYSSLPIIVPQQIPINGVIIGVSCGGDHTVLVTSDGTAWSFGSNKYGQLGLGDNTDHNTPQQIPIDDIIGVSCGYNHTVLVKRDGTAWSFGSNKYGQLGLGDNTDHNTPQQIPTINDVDIIGVSCGGDHTVLVKSDGTAWSFGSNKYGQLGLGNNTDQSVPQQIPTINGVIGVSCGYYHTVLVKRDGTAWSCGYNGFGELGLGNNINQNIPQLIQGVTNVVGVACGPSSTVLIDENEQVWTFGGNFWDGGVPTQIENFILQLQPIPIAAQAALMFAADELKGRPQTVGEIPPEILRIIAKQDGGNGEYYRKKYLKYKAKYLQLKNN